MSSGSENMINAIQNTSSSKKLMMNAKRRSAIAKGPVISNLDRALFPLLRLSRFDILMAWLNHCVSYYDFPSLFFSSIRLRNKEFIFITAVFIAFRFSSKSPFSIQGAVSKRN